MHQMHQDATDAMRPMTNNIKAELIKFGILYNIHTYMTWKWLVANIKAIRYKCS